MRSKEEIFKQCGVGELREMEYEEHIKEAMDEYAKEVAIDFANYAFNNFIKHHTNEFGIVSIKVDSELFELYKKENNIQ